MQRQLDRARDDYCRKVGEAFYPLQIDRLGDERPVVTRFASHRQGWLRVTRGSVDTNMPIFGRRDWRNIETSTPDEFVLMAAGTSSLAYRQFGRRSELAPGSMVLIDARTPYEFERRTAGSVVCHHVPGTILREAVPHPEDLCSVTIEGRRGVGATLKALVNAVWQQMEELSEPERYMLLGNIATLLPLACGQAEREIRLGKPANDPPFRRALRFIEENIDDPGLGPRAISDAAGVSLSHLHALAARNGTTIGTLVQDMRLDLCARALSRADHADSRITDIAFSHGFNDAAHFSRAFKRKFSMTAREYRLSRQVKPS